MPLSDSLSSPNFPWSAALASVAPRLPLLLSPTRRLRAVACSCAGPLLFTAHPYRAVAFGCLPPAQVADFGLSKILQAKERSTLECDMDATGTVAYMAPEVLDGSMCPAAGTLCLVTLRCGQFEAAVWACARAPWLTWRPRCWTGRCARQQVRCAS